VGIADHQPLNATDLLVKTGQGLNLGQNLEPLRLWVNQQAALFGVRSHHQTTSTSLHQRVAYARWYRHAPLGVDADRVTTCEHFSPLEGIIFHKKPQLPTFSHGAHYKSGQGKVKRGVLKTEGKTVEKSGIWRTNIRKLRNQTRREKSKKQLKQ